MNISDLKAKLIGRIIVVHDCTDEKGDISLGHNRIMGEYEILDVLSPSMIQTKDYPTETCFARSEDLERVVNGGVAFIHPDEVYAYLKLNPVF